MTNEILDVTNDATPNWTTIVDDRDSADMLRALGIPAIALAEPRRLNADLPRGPGSEVLLVGTPAQRIAGDLRKAGTEMTWYIPVPLGYTCVGEYLNRLRQIHNPITDEELRSLWQMVEAGGRLLEGIDPTDHPDAPGRVPPSQLPAVLDWTEVAELPPPEWQIEGLFPKGSFVVLAGPPSSAKSLLAIDWCLRLAHGLDFRSRRVKPCSVLYLAGEGYAGISVRLRAWRRQNSVEAVSDQYFVIADGVPNLSKPAGIAELRALILQQTERHGHPPGLIVIDTLSQSFGDGDENDSSVVAPVLRALQRLRTEFGCSFLIIHHVSKTPSGTVGGITLNSVRGSSALVANVDVVMVMAGADDTKTLKVLKLRDGEQGKPIPSKILVVETGRTLEDGRPERSVILVEAPEDVGADVRLESDRITASALIEFGVEGASQKQLEDATGLPHATQCDTLKRLQRQSDAPVVRQIKGGRVRWFAAQFARVVGADADRLSAVEEPDIGDDEDVGVSAP